MSLISSIHLKEYYFWELNLSSNLSSQNSIPIEVIFEIYRINPSATHWQSSAKVSDLYFQHICKSEAIL